MNYAYEKLANLSLRVAIAFAFIYPPLSAYIDPYSWIGYFPEFIKAIVPNEMLLLHSFGALEIIIGLWILSGVRIFWPASIAGIMLLLIVVFNLQNFDVIFRDISIALGAFALAVLSRKEKVELA